MSAKYETKARVTVSAGRVNEYRQWRGLPLADEAMPGTVVAQPLAARGPYLVRLDGEAKTITVLARDMVQS